MNPSWVARVAQLAMALEVSATPKPGNIDRDHDYEDTRYEHFLASAISAYPILLDAAEGAPIGRCIHRAVEESTRWQDGGNTHFGAFLLLMPLVGAASKVSRIDDLREVAHRLALETTVDDAVEVYRAFSHVDVRVGDVEDLDVRDSGSVDRIRELGHTLYHLMEVSSSYDIIAREWVEGFPRTFECARLIKENTPHEGVNRATVRAFLNILSRNTDTFIQTKFDEDKAKEVSQRAASLLEDFDLEEIHEFDDVLLREGVNPGSTADIVIAGLFVALLGGLRI